LSKQRLKDAAQALRVNLRSGRQLGNFPQAFTHVALVNTAMNLSAEAKPVEQRAEKKVA
jgi:hypothetical protein